MQSPSIEIFDVNDVWIYLVSIKEKKVFEQDEIEFQNIYRFEFNSSKILKKKKELSMVVDLINSFSKEKNKSNS